LVAWLGAACGSSAPAASPPPAAAARAGEGSAAQAPATAPTAGGAPADACAVVSPADIRTALGVAPSGSGQGKVVGVEHTCDWPLANQATLRVALFTSPNAQTLTSTSGSGFGPAWQPVAGLGQRAGYRRYNFTPQVVVAEVQVLLAQRSFFVQVTGQPDQLPAKDMLIALARKVAGRVS
jgi:hypothetical protein